MHSLRILGLGAAFALAGIALFAVTLRKPAESKTVTMKKSELREREAQRVAHTDEAKKLRLVGALCIAVGAVLMILS